MSLTSKLKEAVFCLKAGKVTLPYPAKAEPVPERFRGRPVFDGSKCIGCAGCANNCPAREILLFDKCQEIRILEYLGRRCTYCGRCADMCPEKAVTMSHEFENATNAIGDAYKLIQHGDADVMITGGTEAAVTRMGLSAFQNMRALSARNDDPLGGSQIGRQRPGDMLAV